MIKNHKNYMFLCLKVLCLFYLYYALLSNIRIFKELFQRIASPVMLGNHGDAGRAAGHGVELGDVGEGHMSYSKLIIFNIHFIFNCINIQCPQHYIYYVIRLDLYIKPVF